MKLLRDQRITPRETAMPRTVASPEIAGASGDDAAETPGRANLSGRQRALLIAAAVGAMGLAAHWAANTPGFAVRRVIIEGAQHSHAGALAESTGAVGVNAFKVDLHAVRRAVLADPWIADARVRRVLPHELRVAVTERVAVGVRDVTAGHAAGGRALVDAEGRVLEEGPAAEGSSLPSITGLSGLDPKERASRVARAAASLGALRVSAPHLFETIQSIDASSQERLTLLRESGPPIFISGPQSADEVASYASRMESLRRAMGELEYVDARWSHRLFVMPKKLDG